MHTNNTRARETQHAKRAMHRKAARTTQRVALA
jgi:hypothetical protein